MAGIEIVVFDGIARPQDMDVFEALETAHHRQLNIKRQAGRHALRIDLMGVEPFRFKKDLVAVLARKAMDLVFDGGTIARPHSFNDPGKHRRSIKT